MINTKILKSDMIRRNDERKQSRKKWVQRACPCAEQETPRMNFSQGKFSAFGERQTESFHGSRAAPLPISRAERNVRFDSLVEAVKTGIG